MAISNSKLLVYHLSAKNIKCPHPHCRAHGPIPPPHRSPGGRSAPDFLAVWGHASFFYWDSLSLTQISLYPYYPIYIHIIPYYPIYIYICETWHSIGQSLSHLNAVAINHWTSCSLSRHKWPYRWAPRSHQKCRALASLPLWSSHNIPDNMG
jgi:hypothetical protein